LSGLEGHIRLAQKESDPEALSLISSRAATAAATACEAEGIAKAQVLPCSVALTPFWGGYGASAHSFSPLSDRLNHLRATVCSLRRNFEKVVVGACSDFAREHYHGMTDLEIVKSLDLPGVSIVELTCEQGEWLSARRLHRVLNGVVDVCHVQ
jgi:hypothetical protein